MKKITRLLAAACFVLLSAGMIFPALAHSQKEATAPKNGEVLTSPPEVIAMTFDKPMRVIQFKILNKDNKSVKLKKNPSRAAVTNFKAVPTELSAGSYTVKWRGLSGDGHPMKGSFSFSIK